MNQTRSDANIPPLIHGNEMVMDDIDKANLLSDQYNSVFTVDNGILPDYDCSAPIDSFSWINISENDNHGHQT